MCETCGCGLTPPRPPLHGVERGEPETELVPVGLYEKILAGNDRTARHNREHFAAQGLLALNLMGSPGAGKTAVLEATSGAATERGWRLAAVSADLATDRDAQRLQAAGIPSRAITTGQACHLDARLVHDALHGFDLDGAGILFIENVGNLVCPAIYDLGQRANVVVLSVAEGEDKPLKYPVMFKAADLVLITKLDLAGVLGTDLPLLEENLARVMPAPRAIRLSARTGEGMAEWLAWLADQKASAAAEAAATPPPSPHHHVHLHGHTGIIEGRAHEHVHTHVHRHGDVTHSHAHAHVHAHVHGHGEAGGDAARAHAHEGGAAHAHDHGPADRPAAARGATAGDGKSRAVSKRGAAAKAKAKARARTAAKGKAKGRKAAPRKAAKRTR